MVESSNLCIVGMSSFLGSYLVFSLLGFGACRDLHDKPKFFENGFRMENLLRFRVGNIIGLIHEESSTPSHVCQLDSFYGS